jgi:hypothetical protein
VVSQVAATLTDSSSEHTGVPAASEMATNGGGTAKVVGARAAGMTVAAGVHELGPLIANSPRVLEPTHNRVPAPLMTHVASRPALTAMAPTRFEVWGVGQE